MTRAFIVAFYKGSMLIIFFRSCLKPGGWAEFQDWDAMVHSADGTSKGTYIERYMLNTLAAFEKAGYITRPGIYLEKWMKDAGFVNVRVHKHIVPLGTWAKEKHYVGFFLFPFCSCKPLYMDFSVLVRNSLTSHQLLCLLLESSWCL